MNSTNMVAHRAISRVRNLLRRWPGIEVLRVGESAMARQIRRANIATVTYGDQRALFYVDQEADHIQRVLMSGHFYEEAELEIISRHFGGEVFVDIGANIGNHSIFAAKVLGAKSVLAFEPNPVAYVPLRLSIVLNDLQDVVVHKAIGLSDCAGYASASTPPNNLGGTTLLVGDGGGIVVERGDDALSGHEVDFIKIDVEGMEMEVLQGLEGTLARSHPTLFVEVAAPRIALFEDFLRRVGYSVAETFDRYPGMTNFLAVPIESGK